MKNENIENTSDKNENATAAADPLTETREIIDESIDLMSTKLLEGLQRIDWDKWQRRHCIPRTASLARLARLLCTLSAALRPLEKERDRKAAQREQLKAAFGPMLSFLDASESNDPSDNDKPNHP